ncbi:DUF262 domain-containing protein [Bacteroides sp. 214]|uniref:DUF262 domain-containing protein n=1 Tax=Bacteroides sp. 214 TaxID=2302935 RepID=UPI0013D82534|nr:DUF262 domain-containing protein [Bacteroides sp. 214]NDW11924.1 DUF262 domain-containing protein [Bacteroides sp. 214]
MNTGRYSLIQLLNNNEIEQIIIPEIQRDYVWGEENVIALLESIWSNFKNKNKMQLSIKDGEKQVDENMLLFLSKEYSKIRHATQIGFIYAYHDVEYAGKFFLIDGQQRITSLYLLLLALYKKTEKETDFASLYFQNRQLKLDYKVREVSHDFMQSFVEHILTNESVDFENTSNYYQNIYKTDITTVTLSKNFDTIFSFSAFKGVEKNELVDFIDYIENYIEFNYFDTNLSEQGEQLYLYMNSRGESLSTQEIIKTTIIKRAANKKEAGRKWEEWQNFFWKYRKGGDEKGNKVENPNADKGFEEFLKWATIIHICSNDEKNIKLKPVETKNNKTQTTLEVKEDYIRFEPENKWLKQYQKENESFDINFLDNLFCALQYLQNNKSERLTGNNLLESPYFRDNWLSKTMPWIDYSTVLSVIFFLSKSYKIALVNDVDSLGMYFKNIRYRQTNVDNPTTTVIRCLESTKYLLAQNCFDITFLKNVEKGSRRIVNDSDEIILSCYKQSNRKEWEDAIWSITNQDDFASFLDGNYSFFFECSKNGQGEYSVDEFVKYKELFFAKIYNRKNEDELRRELLTIGDYMQNDGGGSWNLNGYMERRNANTNEKKNWENILLNKAELVKEYLTPQVINKVEPYSDTWREPFIVEKSVFDYMGQKKFLRTDEGRIVLLHGHQAGVYNSRAIQIQLFHVKLPKSWVHTYDICVQEFDFVNSKIEFKESNNDIFLFIDVQYEWKNNGGEWYLYIGYRKGEEKVKFDYVLNLLDSATENWILIDDQNKKKMKQPFFIDKSELSIMQNVNEAFNKFRSIIFFDI